MQRPVHKRPTRRALIAVYAAFAIAACGGGEIDNDSVLPNLDSGVDAGGDVTIGDTGGTDAEPDVVEDTAPDVVEDTAPDVVEDTAPDIDLPEVIELPDEVVAIDTVVSTTTVAAGGEVQVDCVLIDALGREFEPPTPPRFVRDVVPDTGATVSSDGVLTPTRVGQLEVVCSAAEYDVIDLEPAIIDVVAGPPATVLADVEPEQVVAGEPATVECAVFDAFGNPIADAEPRIETTPSGDGVGLDGDTLTITRADLYAVSCLVDGASEIVPDTLEVRPGLPASIAVGLAPSLELYAIGDVVSVVTIVTDIYDNVVDTAPVSWSSEPAVPGFGVGRYRFDAEGIFRLTATVGLPTETGEPLVGFVDAYVNSGGPDIRCDEPIDGAMLDITPGSTVTVRGTVTDAFGAGVARVGDTEVDVADDGTFAIDVTTRYGINFIDIEATDGFGAENSTTCAFLVSDTWTEEGGWLDGDIGFGLMQAGLDDADRSGGVSSIGDLLHLALNSESLVRTLDEAMRGANPLLPSRCVQEACLPWVGCSCVYRLSVSYRNGSLAVGGLNTVALNWVDGGLRVQGTVRDISIGLNIGGTISTNGTVRVGSVGIDLTFDVGLDGAGRPSVSLRSINNVTVGSVDTSFSGVAGFIIDIIAGIAEGTIRNLVRDTVRDFLRDNFAEILDGVLSGLDVSSLGSSFAVPRLDGSGTIDLGFGVRFSSLGINPARALFGLGTRFTGTISRVDETLGAPRPSGPVLLSPTTDRGVAAAIQHGLLNQVLHTLWRGSFFDATIEGAGLGGGLPDGLSAALQTNLPPMVVGVDGDGAALDLHFGAARLDLVWPGLFDEPLNLRIGAVASTAVRLEGEDLVFEDVTLTELHFATDAVSLDGETRRILEGFLTTLVQTILDDALNGALPSLPIPSFALPESLTEFGLPTGELGLTDPRLTTLPAHFVVDGNLGIR